MQLTWKENAKTMAYKAVTEVKVRYNRKKWIIDARE